MTKLDTDAIRARCEAATPGPWKINKHTLDCGYGFISGLGRDICRVYNITNYEVFKGNLDFIAHARQDIPALLDALEKSEARAKTLERAIKTTCWEFCKNHRGLGLSCQNAIFDGECKFRSMWQFDEARFVGVGENV